MLFREWLFGGGWGVLCHILKENSFSFGLEKIQVIRDNQVYISSSNVLADTTVIVMNYMLNEKFTFYFKIIIKWNLTKSHAIRLKSAKYKTHKMYSSTKTCSNSST